MLWVTLDKNYNSQPVDLKRAYRVSLSALDCLVICCNICTKCMTGQMDQIKCEACALLSLARGCSTPVLKSYFP